MNDSGKNSGQVRSEDLLEGQTISSMQVIMFLKEIDSKEDKYVQKLYNQ